MKRVMILLVLFSLKINSDEIAPPVEMFFGTEQAYDDSITFSLLNQGQVWGGINSNDCNFSWYTTSLFNSPSYTVTTHNQPVGSWAGLYFTTSSDGYQIFGYGLYKVKNSESDSYFYIDYRDQRVGCSPYGNNGHFIDVWFKYNATLDKFYYSNNSSDFFQISNGQLLRIWELKNAGTPQTSSLPNYWTKCLVLVPSINNNPHLVWGPYPNSTPSGYRIYRSISQISHPTQPFQIIGTTLSNTFDFIDYEIRLNQTGSYVFYYITAIINGSNSSASNTVMARGDLYKENSKNENVLAENQLYENYPNPFNPSTKISWQSPVSSWQVLKVFDVLGNEIATLVDEYREAGRYESEFDASNLSSGIYYYKLQSGSFVGTKKMVLLR